MKHSDGLPEKANELI